MPGLRSLSRVLRATTDGGDLLLGLGLLQRADAVGLGLRLGDGQLGDLAVQEADRPAGLDRHADLELHLLDDPLAQGGHVRLLDPVEAGQVGQDQRLDRPGPVRPAALGAAALGHRGGAEQIKQPAARAAIRFGIDMIGRDSSSGQWLVG